MEEPKMQTFPAAKNTFLECERDIVFILMMLTAGYFGAFTYSIRGGVFCNAQTGNKRGKARCMKWNKCHYLTTEDSLLPLPPG